MNVDVTLGILLDEMRRGFEAVNDRLDQINGQVRRHGEQIAVLENQATGAAVIAGRNEEHLDDIRADFIAHRARCPFDQGVQANGSVTANDQAVLDLANRIRRNRIAVAAGAGGGVVLLVIEVLPRVIAWVHTLLDGA